MTYITNKRILAKYFLHSLQIIGNLAPVGWFSPATPHIYSWLPMLTLVYLYFLLVYSCVPMLLVHLFLPLFTWLPVYHCLLMFNSVYHCLLVLVYLCLPKFVFTYVDTCWPILTPDYNVYLCLLAFIYVYHCFLVPVYICLHMFTCVYLRWHLFTCFLLYYSCLPMFTLVCQCLLMFIRLLVFTYVYLFLPVFTRVYQSLPIFTRVYLNLCLPLSTCACLPMFTHVY